MNIFFKCTTLCFLYLIAGCTTINLALDENDWTGQSQHIVHGRNGFSFNQSLQFAEFATSKIKRSWTTVQSAGKFDDLTQISEEYTKKHQAYSFTIRDTINNEFKVSCAINVAQTDLIWQKNNPASKTSTEIKSSIQSQHNLFVIITNPKDNEDIPWRLTLNNNAYRSRDRYAGCLYQSEEEYYNFVPITQIKAANGRHVLNPSGVLGYEIFDQDGKPVAAVSLLNKGAVYFKVQTPGERLILASVCSALLLQPHDFEDE